jgi:hypothetical protein
MEAELAIICSHVSDEARPVKLVVRHSDGGWSFMCGEYDHDIKDAVVVHAAHIFERHTNLEELRNLKTGLLAELGGDEWVLTHHDD